MQQFTAPAHTRITNLASHEGQHGVYNTGVKGRGSLHIQVHGRAQQLDAFLNDRLVLCMY